ncbi:MAG: hypothetical protein AAF226_19460 [Verrucomicrobiota bacterium]
MKEVKQVLIPTGLENAMEPTQPTEIIDKHDVSHIDPATLAGVAIALLLGPLLLAGFFLH